MIYGSESTTSDTISRKVSETAISELTKKHSILQERWEESKQAAVKKEESSSDWQELANLEAELQRFEARNLEEEACEIVDSTKIDAFMWIFYCRLNR